MLNGPRLTRRAIAAGRALEPNKFLTHENMLRLLIAAESLQFIAGDLAPPEARRIIAQGLQFYTENGKALFNNRITYTIRKPFPAPKTKYTAIGD